MTNEASSGTDIKPFRVDVPQSELDDLKLRLEPPGGRMICRVSAFRSRM